MREKESKAFHFAAAWGEKKALLWQIAHEVHQEKIYIFSLSINVQAGKNTENHKSFPTLF